MFYSIVKITFHKEEPKTIIYCDYKTLETFSSELFSKRESQDNNKYQTFAKELVNTLNNQAPKKSSTFRGNQKPYINKALRNAIMKRSKLKNKANKTKSACFKKIQEPKKFIKKRFLIA